MNDSKRNDRAGLISRVADCCIWFGRYVERSESTARELQATLHLALDGELTPRQCWFPMIVIAGEEGPVRERLGEIAFADGELVQNYLVWEENCGVSLKRSVRGARENARAIRDVLSGEVWEAINELYLWLGDPAAEQTWNLQRDAFYRRVRQSSQLSLGLLRSTMLHDCVLDFIWLGMLLERIGQTARLMDVHHHAFVERSEAHPVVETTVWSALLRAFSGYESYLKNIGAITPDGVAAFLVTEGRFPRSLAYCVRSARERLAILVPPDQEAGQIALRRLTALDAYVRDVANHRWVPGAMHNLLTHIVNESAAVFDLIGQELLGYTPPADTALVGAEA
jgi:uncharacterized alpha-E superfamily protein